MSDKNEKKWRRFLRKNYAEKINGAANAVLRREIFRLARNRDVLGIALIASILAIIALSIILFRYLLVKHG